MRSVLYTVFRVRALGLCRLPAQHLTLIGRVGLRKSPGVRFVGCDSQWAGESSPGTFNVLIIPRLRPKKSRDPQQKIPRKSLRSPVHSIQRVWSSGR